MSHHTIHPDLLTTQVNIALVGAGGNGSQMLTGPARLHTAMLALQHPAGLRVTVYDPDRVSESNVGRQLFPIRHRAVQGVCAGPSHQLLPWPGLGGTAYALHYAPHLWARPDGYCHPCVDSAASRREIENLWQSAGQVLRTTGLIWAIGRVTAGDLRATRSRSSISSASWTASDGAVAAATADGDGPVSGTGWQQADEGRMILQSGGSLEKQDPFINDHVTRWALHLPGHNPHGQDRASRELSWRGQPAAGTGGKKS